MNAGLILVVLADAIIESLKLDSAEAHEGRLHTAAVICGMLGFTIIIGGYIGVWLFNRPRLLIPPAFRGEPGLLEELRNRRKA